MTAYSAIVLLIKEKLFSTYEDAWRVIFNAYNGNRIDHNELDELANLAEKHFTTQ